MKASELIDVLGDKKVYWGDLEVVTENNGELQKTNKYGVSLIKNDKGEDVILI